MDAEANIGEADGPKGEPQDAASNPAPLSERHWIPAFAGMTTILDFGNPINAIPR